MSLLLCSTSPTLLDRWHQALSDQYSLLKVSQMGAIVKTIREEEIELILLHRTMVNVEILAQLAKMPLIVLVDRPEDEEAVALLRLGILGYLNAYVSAPRLSEVVKAALAGRVWIGRSMMQKIIRGTTADLDSSALVAPPADTNISAREWEVGCMVAKGAANLEIAADLDITERTVKAHISSLFKKTKTGSRLQLALYFKQLFRHHHEP